MGVKNKIRTLRRNSLEVLSIVTDIQLVRSFSLDPWWNLAVEEYLLDRVKKGCCILYLWQNQNTVVIGKNQNPWRECRIELLEKEEGRLARRLSGGGAVFHDTGNLNFTFVMNREDYDLERQAGVILMAARSVGISAEMTGRNDITVEGRKFSGNAFCFRKENAYHHGTILVSADMDKLSRYLQVSAEKMKSKGVQSVQSRVTNLAEYQPSLSIEKMASAMVEAFKNGYTGNESEVLDISAFDSGAIKMLNEKYASWEWRYGEAPKFDIDFETRFPWGGVEIGLKLEKGKVAEARVYSDAMDEALIGRLPEALKRAAFSSTGLADSIRRLKGEQEGSGMLEDIARWIESKEL